MFKAASLSILAAVFNCFLASGQSSEADSANKSLQYLRNVMDYYHSRFPVYDDVSSPENHFVAYAKIPADEPALVVNGSWPTNPHSGATALRFELGPNASSNFGGFYFL